MTMLVARVPTYLTHLIKCVIQTGVEDPLGFDMCKTFRPAHGPLYMNIYI